MARNPARREEQQLFDKINGAVAKGDVAMARKFHGQLCRRNVPISRRKDALSDEAQKVLNYNKGEAA